MENTKEWFLSCDWGTTAFRLRLVDANKAIVIAEDTNENGIANTFTAWKQSGKNENERVQFYQEILRRSIQKLVQKTGSSLTGISLIISGMASSTIGMLEVSYKDLPFKTDGSDLKVHTIKASKDFNHDTLLISGVKSDDDVMRGEELQLAGCLTYATLEEQIIIKPGTHSKHIIVKDGKAIAFKTYMTGELFSLFSKASILAASIEKVEGLNNSKNRQSFEKGVTDSREQNLLHACFLVRTNSLFNKLDKQQNYCYLSGLLIGTELKELANTKSSQIVLLTNQTFQPFYQTALQVLEISTNLEIKDVDEALVKGHTAIYKINN